MPFFGSKPAPAPAPQPPKQLDTTQIQKNIDELSRKRNDCEVRMRDSQTRLTQYKQQFQSNPAFNSIVKTKAMEEFKQMKAQEKMFQMYTKQMNQLQNMLAMNDRMTNQIMQAQLMKEAVDTLKPKIKEARKIADLADAYDDVMDELDDATDMMDDDAYADVQYDQEFESMFGGMVMNQQPQFGQPIYAQPQPQYAQPQFAPPVQQPQQPMPTFMNPY